jgi:hypothetical protein
MRIGRPGQRSVGPRPGTPATDYNTVLSPQEEKQFRQWKARYAPADSGEDYDLRGAFAAGVHPDPRSGHWPDTFKKPNHPTFSVESQYARYLPQAAGTWMGNDFVPMGLM